MATNVNVIYNLTDRISSKADRIQRRVEKLEKTLANVDKLTSDLGRNKGLETYSRKGVAATDRLNARLATSEKKLKAVTSATEKATKKTDLFTKAVDKSSDALIKHNKHLEDLNSWHKQGASNAAVHSAQLREFGNELTKVSRKVNTQVKSLGALDKAAHALEGSLDGLILKEHKLGDAMHRKNTHAREQVGHLKDVDRATDRATKSQRKYNQELSNGQKIAKKFKSIQNDDSNAMFGLLSGMDMGATQYSLLKKLTALLPVIGVGIGGIGSMASGASVGVLGLAGSLTKLSGALAVLPGMYMAAGVAMGTFKGIQNAIFKPAMEGATQLKDLDKQIADAQRSLSQAQTRNASANTPEEARSSIAAIEDAESGLNDLMKERAKIAETMPKNAQKLVDATEKIKDAWRDAWFGEGNKRADQIIGSAVEAMETGVKVIERWDNLFQKGANLFSNMAETATLLSQNPLFMGPAEKALENSFDNANKMVNILGVMAPLVAVLGNNAAIVTGEVLNQAAGWAVNATTAEKLEETQKRSLKWMREGVAQAKKWGAGLKDALSGLYTLSGPAAAEFDKRFFGKDGIFARFDRWAKKIEGNGTLKKFTKNSWKVLDGLGGVLMSIAKVLGKIGSNDKATKGTVDFLNQLSGGIESFGGFALKAMIEVGPEINKFFKAFGNAHKGSGDIVIEFLDKLVIAFTLFTKAMDKITPGPLLGIIAGTGAVFTAIGALFGAIAIASRPARGALKGINRLRKGGGAAIKGVGAADDAAKAVGRFGKFGKVAGRLAGAANVMSDLAAPNTHITNTVLNPVPVMIVGGGPLAAAGGMGKMGKMAAGGRAAGGLAGIAGTVVSVLGMAAVAAAIGVLVGSLLLIGQDKLIKWATERENKDFRKDVKDLGDTKDPKERAEKAAELYKGYHKVDVMGQPVYNKMNVSKPTPEAKAGSEKSLYEAQFNGLLESGGPKAYEKLFDHTRKFTGEQRVAFRQSAAGVKWISKVVGSGLPLALDKGFDKGTKATKKGGDKLGVASDKAGRAAWTPLNKWAGEVQKTMTELGVPASALTTGGGTTGTALRLPGGAQGPVLPRTGDSNRPAAGGGGKTGGLAASMGPAVAMANRLGGTITSGFRPGAVTSSGNMSDHSTGNAIDIGGPPALMAQIAMAANALPGVKQVIYSPVGWSRDGGAFSPVTDAAVKADHYDHVHVAMGGKGAGGGGGGMAGLPPLPGFPGTVFGQAVGGLASQAHAFLSSQMGAGGDPTSMGAAGGSMQAIIQQAAGAYGANASGLLAVANAESSFNPTVSNNWDSNALAGTPSKGLFQFIESTFNSMSTQAMAANPSAWTGVNRTWMDPMAQALTAAWAFTHGQGSHWATASRYGTGDSNAPAVNVSSGGSARRSAGSRGGARRSAPRRTAGGGSVFHTTVVVQGALFLNEEGRAQLGDMVGKHVAAQVIKASPNAATETDI